jgi:CBS domain containing-hemolysin-like protein
MRGFFVGDIDDEDEDDEEEGGREVDENNIWILRISTAALLEFNFPRGIK